MDYKAHPTQGCDVPLLTTDQGSKAKVVQDKIDLVCKENRLLITNSTIGGVESWEQRPPSSSVTSEKKALGINITKVKASTTTIFVFIGCFFEMLHIVFQKK